ncbi:MAG: hypothetical protein ABTQ25_02985 [Nitrosomonas ureae]
MKSCRLSVDAARGRRYNAPSSQYEASGLLAIAGLAQVGETRGARLLLYSRGVEQSGSSSGS